MLQVIMLVVGVWYVFEFLTIGSSGLKLGLPPEVLVEWRAQRKKQYLWGIAAGWGSLVAGILTSVGMTPSYPTTTDVARAQLSMIVVTAIVLIGCLVVSIAASKKAKSFEQKWTSLGYGMPGAYPPAANQPGAYPPSAQAPASATPIAAPLAPVGEGPLMTENQSQGTATCLNCGAQFPSVGARFCPACGGAVAVSQAPSWAPFAAPAPMPAAPVAPPSVPSAPAPDYGQPQGYGQPPTTQQPQGYGPVPGYPTGYGYAPTPARRNSTPLLVGLGLVGLVIVIIAGAVLLSSAGGHHATSAASVIALATPTGGATPTAVPRSTPAPTQTPIPASHDAITVGDYTIKITGVTLSDNGTGGFVPASMTSDQTVLGVEATLVSGGTLTDLSKVQVWTTDESGDRYDVGAALSIDAQNGAIWMYAVPKTSSLFLWWFPSGEVIDLSPLLSTSSSATPVPTVVATPAGTSWEVFSAYETVEHATQVADTQAWNDASNPSTTYAAATRAKADDQADLAWLKANPPTDCYSVLYNDLVLYDNQDIKTMDDWFAGRDTTVNNVDLPALNAIWHRVVSELTDAEGVCS